MQKLIKRLTNPALAFSAAVLLLPELAGAQTRITLNEAVRQGLEASKTLKISESKIAANQAVTSQVHNASLPSVKVTTGYSRLSNNIPALVFPGSEHPLVVNYPNNYVNRLTVQQLIYHGNQEKYAERSAEYLTKASQYDYQKDKTEVVYNVAAAYYNIYKLEATKNLLAENHKQIEEHLKETKNFENRGLLTRNDVLKVQLQLSNVELAQSEVANNLAVATYNLGIMLGQPEGTNIQIDTVQLFQAKALADMNAFIQQGIAERADLKAADWRSKSAMERAKVARTAYYPTIGLSGNYEVNNPNHRQFPLVDKFKNTWDAGIALTWDISSLYTARHGVAEAIAVEKQNQLAFDQTTDAVKMEVNQSYLGYKLAQEKIALNRKAVEQALENYRMFESRYKNNVASTTDLLDANLAMLQSKVNLETARADAELAYQKLLKSTGTSVYSNGNSNN
jgi:outer membrane protein TolC